jgi:multidrug efflux pump subunit AcrA (membrane-fusion protein)
MALDKDFLIGEGVGVTEDQAEKILKEFDSETIGLKAKRDQLITAEKALKEKHDKSVAEYETAKTAFQKQIEDLEAKLKASGSDDLKAYYEAEIKKASEMHAAKLTEADKVKADLEAKNKTLFNQYVGLWKATELDKAMDKVQNLDPAQRGILRDLFWVRHQFDVTKIEDKEELRNGEYKTIQDVLFAYVGTDEGKRFLLANSSGGGAPGGSMSKGFNGKNPWAKDSINLTEQARLLKENPTLAATLKSQAGAGS